MTTPVPLVSFPTFDGGGHFRTDDRFVYYMTGGVQLTDLYRVDKNGGSPQFLMSLQTDGPDDYAVSASQIFGVSWGVDRARDFGPGSVHVLGKDLAPLYDISPIPSRRCETNVWNDAVADADGNLYLAQGNWAIASDECDALSVPVTYALEWVPAGSRNASPIAFSSTSQFERLTLVGDDIFWSNAEGIWRGKKTGGGGELILATGQPIYELQASQEAVFWATSQNLMGGAGQTFRLDLATRTNAQILPYRLLGMVLSDGFLYGGMERNVTTGPRVNLVRVKTNGHGQTFLAHTNPGFTIQAHVETLAVDDEFIYFSDANGENLLKLCK